MKLGQVNYADSEKEDGVTVVTVGTGLKEVAGVMRFQKMYAL